MATKRTRKTVKSARPKRKASAASDKASETTKRVSWQAAMQANKALAKHTRDDDGNVTKDYVYRRFADHYVATGEALSVEALKAISPAYTPSLYSRWRKAWALHLDGKGDTIVAGKTATRIVPKASRDYRPAKTTAAKLDKANAAAKALSKSAAKMKKATK